MKYDDLTYEGPASFKEGTQNFQSKTNSYFWSGSVIQCASILGPLLKNSLSLLWLKSQHNLSNSCLSDILKILQVRQ
jgi:hypothetical protein